jgi:futalosine hydrolase
MRPGMREVVVFVATETEARRLTKSGIQVVVTGVGPVNAAHAVTRRLVESGAHAIASCGIGGAYPGSCIEVGEAVCASTETYADLGAETADGFLDMAALGFPVVAGDPPLFNTLPLDLFPTERRVPFVTRSACTGTDEGAQEIAARTGGAIESMEGAAVVHVAKLFGVPVAEVRGVSNMVGNRDRGSWRVGEAADAAQEALLRWLAS